MNNNQTKEKLYDVVIIRSFAIIMVVAFHAYGMMYADHFPETKDIYYHLYYNVNQLILKFRMPLFIFISGFLFSYLEKERGKYPTFWALLKNKFKRLIIPFWIFCFIFMITTNSFSIDHLWIGSWGHLWFITMLFWCFMFTRLQSFLPFSKTLSWKVLLLIISFFLMQTKPLLPSIVGLQFLTPWFFGFYLGWIVSPNRNLVYKMLSNKVLLILLIAIYIYGVSYTVMYIKTDNVRTIWSESANVAMVFLIWYFVNFFIRKYSTKWAESKIFNELNKCSYGIFVLHNWIQPYMISSTAQRLFPLERWAAEHTILFPFCFFATSFCISFVITKALLRTKVGRFLIG